MSQTISQILNEYHGFEKAFWASYSVSFTTLDFLLTKDFKNIMDPHYVHLICDALQLDESIDKINDNTKVLSKLSKLQEYCTISPQLTEGAFHPKILLLSSDDKLLFIVSSANATASGILSNQDLIATFYYDPENLNDIDVICALFQYLRSFDGWGPEAREDLNVVEEQFSFLLDDILAGSVLTIPNNESLLSQMINGLPTDQSLQTINIFSPFFDDNYTAIVEIEKHFKVPVNIFSPQKEFCTSRKEVLPNSIKFYHSDSQLKKTFHAKFYEFKYPKQSIVFWGSANCSFSGLLSLDRNYEFLLSCQMSQREVHALWGSLDNKEESSVEYGVNKTNSESSNQQYQLYIKGITVSEHGFSIELDKPLSDQAKLKALTVNGNHVDFDIISANNHLVQANCEEPGLIALYIEQAKQRISNLIYINNPYALQARISGTQSPHIPNPHANNKVNTINQAFGYFNFDQKKTANTGSQNLSARKGFWRLPQFKSRSHFSRIINLESFIQERVIKLKDKEDNETFDTENQKTKNNKKPKCPDEIVRIFQKIHTQTNTLLNNIHTIVKKKRIEDIDPSRWLHGLNILNCYIIDTLDKTEAFPKEFDDNIFFNISRISAWIIHNLLDKDDDHQKEIELILMMQELFLGLAVYRLVLAQRFSGSMRSSLRAVEPLNMIKKALYLRYMTYHKFPEYKRNLELSHLTYRDVLAKLPIITSAKKAIETLDGNKISKLIGLEDTLVYSANTNPIPMLLTSSTSKEMTLENILGDQKKYQITAPLVCTDILHDVGKNKQATHLIEN